MTPLFIFGISFYLLLMVVIGYLASRRIRTIEDYLVAGRRMPLFLAVPTIVATWFGAGSCMGVSGTVYSHGFYGVLSDPFGCFLALIISGLFFAIPFRRLGLLTIADVLRHAFGAAFEKVSTLLTIPFYLGTLAGQMLAMGYLFSIVSGEAVEGGILLGSLIVLLYTVTGGMWAVTVTDFVQLGVLVVGLGLVGFICIEHSKDLSLVSRTFLHEFTTLVPNTGSDTHWSAYLGRICMTGLGAIMGQDIIQRFMASRTEKVARFSAITAGFVYLALGMIPLFVGIAGRDILPDLQKPEQLIPLLAQQYLSPLGFTIFTCGLLAAIMSTADSYLLAGTSLVVNNILLKRYPMKTEKNKIKLLRWTNVVYALMAVGLALSGSTIFDLMVHSGVTLFVSIFVPTCAALFWKSTNRSAAWGSLIGGLVGWLGFVFFRSFAFVQSYEELYFSAAFFGAIISLISFVGIAYIKRLTLKIAID
jgi:SSS family solute:Na+ symporter